MERVSEQFWYRYEDVKYADFDWFGEPTGPGRLVVELRKFTVQKITRKGVRLDNGRFVRREGRKRFACPTVEEAKTSFIARKKRQAAIHQAALWRAQAALSAVHSDAISVVQSLPVSSDTEA